MIGYLILCYVDTKKISHNKNIVEYICSLIGMADALLVDYTFLFRNDNLQDYFENIEDNMIDFFNNPIGIGTIDEEISEIEAIKRKAGLKYKNPNQDVYGLDYKPLYIQFVSSLTLFNKITDSINSFEFQGCQEFYYIPYTISCLDQMEILKKLQTPKTNYDIFQIFLESSGMKKQDYLRKILKNSLN